jgi:hypothetical protein
MMKPHQEPMSAIQQEVLEDALLYGEPVKKLVACETLRREFSIYPDVGYLIVHSKNMMEGFSVVFSSDERKVHKEAAAVLQLCVKNCPESAYIIAGAPFLLHSLCKIAIRNEDSSIVDLLTAMSIGNEKVLWLVSNLCKASALI